MELIHEELIGYFVQLFKDNDVDCGRGSSPRYVFSILSCHCT